MKAINYHIKGIIITFQHLLKGKYLLYFLPGLIITGIFWYFRTKSIEIDESIDLTSDDSWFSTVSSSIGSAVDTGTSWLVSWLDYFFELIYIFLVLTALSPFFTILGEKFDEELTGRESKGGIIRFINDIIRMIFVVIISLILQGIIISIYWLISYIFGIPEIVDTVVSYCISGFFFGFTFYDFALERYKKGVFASLAFAFSAPLGMILIGAIFKAIYAIPYFGIPIAPVLVVMISTVAYAYYTKQLPKSNQLSNE